MIVPMAAYSPFEIWYSIASTITNAKAPAVSVVSCGRILSAAGSNRPKAPGKFTYANKSDKSRHFSG